MRPSPLWSDYAQRSFADVDEYDPATDSWRARTPIHVYWGAKDEVVPPFIAQLPQGFQQIVGGAPTQAIAAGDQAEQEGRVENRQVVDQFGFQAVGEVDDGIAVGDADCGKGPTVFGLLGRFVFPNNFALRRVFSYYLVEELRYEVVAIGELARHPAFHVMIRVLALQGDFHDNLAFAIDF